MSNPGPHTNEHDASIALTKQRGAWRRLSTSLERAGLPDPGVWAGQAACRDTLGSDWYADADTADGLAAQARAKAVCAGCPVQDLCFRTALARDERHGIWGGLTPAERRAQRRTAA